MYQPPIGIHSSGSARALVRAGAGRAVVFAVEEQGKEARTGLHDQTCILLFFSSARSGPSRRMESLLAHIARKERHRLRVVQVDFDERREVADKLGVETAPTLVLVRGRSQIARLEGRASAPRIEAMLEEHLGEAAAAA